MQATLVQEIRENDYFGEEMNFHSRYKSCAKLTHYWNKKKEKNGEKQKPKNQNKKWKNKQTKKKNNKKQKTKGKKRKKENT